MRPVPSPSSASEVRFGLGAAAGAAILYGAAYPAIAVALRSFSPLAIAGWSSTVAFFLVTGLALAGLVPWPQITGMRRERLARLVVLAVLGGAGFIAAVNVAVALSGPTITGFVAPLYAVMATLFAVPILGEPVRGPTIAAFALALVGTFLLAGGTPIGAPLTGILVALAAAAMFGLYLVLARRWATPYHLDGTLVTIANLLARGLPLLAVAAVVEPRPLIPERIDPAAVVALLSLVVASSTAASLLVMASVRRVPARRTSAALLLTPISSAVLGALILGERLTPIGLLGAALILVGMAGASGILELLPGRPATGSPGLSLEEFDDPPMAGRR